MDIHPDSFEDPSVFLGQLDESIPLLSGTPSHRFVDARRRLLQQELVIVVVASDLQGLSH